MKLSEKQKKGIIIATACIVIVGATLGIVFGVVLSHRRTAVRTVAPTSPPHIATSPPKTTKPTKTAKNTYIQGVKAKSMHLYYIAM